jgi:hypothetical protein
MELNRQTLRIRIIKLEEIILYLIRKSDRFSAGLAGNAVRLI